MVPRLSQITAMKRTLSTSYYIPAPKSLGARLADRAVRLSRRLAPVPAIEVLGLVFEPHRGAELTFADGCRGSEAFLHPRFGGAFPDLLAEAFSTIRARDGWRRELEAAEANDDLLLEDALLRDWELEVTARFRDRYALSFELW